MATKKNIWNKILFALSAAAMAGSAAAATFTATIEKGQLKNSSAITNAHARILGDLKNIVVVETRFDLVHEIRQSNNTPESQFWIKAPGEQTVSLTAKNSSKPYTAKVYAKYIGGSVAGPNRLLIDRLGGCTNVGPSENGTFDGNFMWKINDPSSPQGCSARPVDNRVVLANRFLSNLTIAFEVDASELLKHAPTGTYKGSLQYHQGGSRGYSFGTKFTPLTDVSRFDLNFEIHVIADLHVELPETSVTLAPQGGWAGRIGALPNSLQHAVSFTVTTNDPVSLSLQCQKTDSSNNCLISNQNDKNITVPLGIELSLPASAGTQQLRHNGTTSGLRFTGQPAVLKFSVDQRGVDKMAEHRGIAYSGDVTVIFDAN